MTGAASGIGRATAILFGGDRDTVVAIDIDGDALAQVASAIEGSGGTCLTFVEDVADSGAWGRILVGLPGSIDVVHANAGVFGGAERPVESVDDALIDRLLTTNIAGTIRTIRATIPRMRRGGSIVVTSSTAGVLAHPGGSVYASTKIALIGLVRSVAAELAPRGIRVNAVCPGAVRTPLLDEAYPTTAADEIVHYRAHNPLGTIAEPIDVAWAVRWLSSTEARHVTGTTLLIDGGDSIAVGTPSLPAK